jgi:hypothetical protein
MPINLKVTLCGAKARQNNNQPCRQPAMLNKERCRLHGGKSTGPKTAAGKLKSAQANLKHGLYTNAAMEEKREMQVMMRWRKDLDGEDL